MQCVLDPSTDALERGMVDGNTYVLSTDTAPISASVVDGAYATMPMAAIRPTYQSLDEEELHTSFENAISGRLNALHERLNSISNAQLHNPQQRSSHTNGIIPVAGVTTSAASDVDFTNMPTMAQLQPQPALSWQRRLMYIGLALIFIMLGFDLMGLLALHIR
jgi:hypothetical protein